MELWVALTKSLAWKEREMMAMNVMKIPMDDREVDDDDVSKKRKMIKFPPHLGFLHVPHNKLAHHFLPSLNNDDC